MAVNYLKNWVFLLSPNTINRLYKRCDEFDKKISEVEQRLAGRLDKLEKIERIAGNVARERAARPRNWTQFRALAEGAEEPNAQRR